jgi:Zn-dependent metalloprotease
MAHPRLMMLATLGSLLGLLIATAPVVDAQSQSRGRLQDAYVERGGVRPAWVEAALEQSLRYFEGKGKSRLAFKLRSVQKDDLATHVRLDQLYRGLPVFGGQLITHIDSDGHSQTDNGRFYEGLKLSTTPSVTSAQAIAAAQQALGYKGSFAEAPSARLLVLPQAGGAVLAYQVGLRIDDETDATANHQYFINALDGSVALHYNTIHSAQSIGTGNSLYSGKVDISTQWNVRMYILRDKSRGDMITTNLRQNEEGKGRIFADRDNVWGDGTTADPHSAAVDAHFGAAQTWDYYLNTFGRRGIDGAGFQIISRVHYGKDYNNAFWNGKVMTYGDGSGTVFKPLVALDVAGHEITHGVTTMTADLIYEKESGALNESFSDIFGTAVEFYSGGVGGRTPDYYIGEDIYVPADVTPGFRNMQNPAEDNDPDHYSVRLFPEPCKPSGKNDSCGVHSNSGIQNHAFYLLAEGGTNAVSGLHVSGIGRAKAEAIFYRALTSYLFPSANFSDARAASLSAAADLYGANSPEYAATAQTWTAVGVQ